MGSVTLPNPVMTASGTSGHGAELDAYLPLRRLGAVVVKSLAAAPWPGNPAPRVREVRGGMLNSVGLQGPGVAAWLEHELPALVRCEARVVVSIWGRSVQGFARAAQMLAEGLPEAARAARGADGAHVSAGHGVLAIEVNVSCPNVEDRSRMFAHSPAAAAEAVAASECGLPRWAKLSPNVPDITEVACAVVAAGAEGLTLVNTLLGMAIDVEGRRPLLGGVGGGLSGAAVHPAAVRAVWECRDALPDAAIVGVGGVRTGVDAVELLLAGANAVQVGSATFADPRAPWRVAAELERWCAAHGVARVEDLCGGARPPGSR